MRRDEGRTTEKMEKGSSQQMRGEQSKGAGTAGKRTGKNKGYGVKKKEREKREK